MTPDELSVVQGKELVLAVLTGQVTYRTHKHIYQDDDLRHAVAAVERADPVWLLRELRSKEYARLPRHDVTVSLSPTLSASIARELGMRAVLRSVSLEKEMGAFLIEAVLTWSDEWEAWLLKARTSGALWGEFMPLHKRAAALDELRTWAEGLSEAECRALVERWHPDAFAP